MRGEILGCEDGGGATAKRSLVALPTSFIPHGKERASPASRQGNGVRHRTQHVERVALVGPDWTIMAANDAWMRAYGTDDEAVFKVGDNFRAAWEQRTDALPDDVRAILKGLRSIEVKRQASFEHTFSKDDQFYRLLISRLAQAAPVMATITCVEVTPVERLSRKYRQLERSLLQIQEGERRRVGRELHDATAQLLVALQLCIIRLKKLHHDSESLQLFADIDGALDGMNREIRALSFLLHPPSLEEAGLVETIDAMARGFARRAELRIAFWFDGEGAAWPRTVEATLYRLAQEALANIHRHARARHVGMRLVEKRKRFLHLIVEDDGIGIDQAAARAKSSHGVGLASMRERVEELGGRLCVRRLDSGTCLIASLPVNGGSRRTLGSL